jgi:hypothetical protein
MGKVFAEGGIVKGEGVIIRKGTGERVPFQITSAPLTKDQADALNEQQEESKDGNCTPPIR